MLTKLSADALLCELHIGVLIGLKCTAASGTSAGNFRDQLKETLI